MSSEFTAQLAQNGFNSADIDALINIAKPQHFPARHILMNQGELADSIYFVLEGLCHACYLTEQGKQFSKEFYWEQDWMIGFEGLIHNQTSPYIVETLTAVNQSFKSDHPVLLPVKLFTELLALLSKIAGMTETF